MNPLNARVEPPFEAGATPALREEQDTESDLAEDDGVDGNLTLVCAQPIDHSCVWRCLRRFAENVRVDEIFYSVSVDPESTGTK